MLTCVFQSKSLALPTETFFHPDKLEELKEEKKEEKKQEKKEEAPKQQQQQQQESKAPMMNLLSTVFRLRRELHKTEEQRARVRSTGSFKQDYSTWLTECKAAAIKQINMMHSGEFKL